MSVILQYLSVKCFFVLVDEMLKSIIIIVLKEKARGATWMCNRVLVYME